MLKPLRLLFLLILLTPSLALAESAPFADPYAGEQHIVSFNSSMTVDQTDKATITETLLYDTGTEQHHGIFRDIPVVQTDAQGHNYYYAFELQSATADGSKVQAQKSRQGNFEEIRLGDPDVTFSGQKTYVLTYTLVPVALRAGDHDRVIWNVTGNGWSIPITQASQSVTLPANVTDAVCYKGTVGSTSQDCEITPTGNQLTASAVNIDPGMGLTWDAMLPSGSFSSYLVAGKMPPLTAGEKFNLGVAAFGGLLLVVALSMGIAGRVKDYRRRHALAVYPIYEAPDALTPAQIGLLIDHKLSNAEVAATLLDLAVRGYIRIVELPSSWSWLTGRNYRLEKLKDADDNLDGYARRIFDAVIGGKESVELGDLKNDTSVAIEIQKARKDLGKELTDKGYYKFSPTGGLASLAPHGIGVVIGVIYVFGNLGAQSFSALVWLIPVFGIIALIVEFRRSSLTPAGGEEWAKVEGFKWFLKMTEADRLKFTDAPGKTPEQFSQFLPYAVALNVEKEWAKQFEGIDVTQSVGGWYGGSSLVGFNAAMVASSLGSSFSGAVSSSFAGSGGGGGAGGGGGGGGGGGW